METGVSYLATAVRAAPGSALIEIGGTAVAASARGFIIFCNLAQSSFPFCPLTFSNTSKNWSLPTYSSDKLAS